jgi:hypothetical protein
MRVRGEPEYAECGCSISLGMHWRGEYKVAGPLRGKHLLNTSLAVGITINRLSRDHRGGLIGMTNRARARQTNWYRSASNFRLQE